MNEIEIYGATIAALIILVPLFFAAGLIVGFIVGFLLVSGIG